MSLSAFQIHRHPAGYLFRAQVEASAGDRSSRWGDEHQAVLIQLAGDPSHVDAPYPAAVAKIDAVVDPQRLGGDEVAAHHADARPPHGGVGQPHGELGRDVVLQTAAHLLDDGEALVVGDPTRLWYWA